MKPRMSMIYTLAAAAMLSTPVALYAQAHPTDATVKGTATNAAGITLNSGEVKFTKDKTEQDASKRKFAATGKVNPDGTYTITGIPPGDYLVILYQGDKSLDFMEVTLKAGEDSTLNFDMTRKEYLDKMSPEDKAALEEYKKKIASVSQGNKVVANLNNTLKDVRADLTAASPTKADVSKDVTQMKSAIDSKPDESVLWIVYADTQQAQADHLAAEDRAAKRSVMSDADAMKLYSDATESYKKGIELNAASKKPAPADQAVAYNQMGNTFGKLGKVQEASDAFESAVKLDAPKAGMYYNNEAAILYNTQQMDGALAAAEKAIAADPSRPDPYYVKGQALVRKATVDPKTQKIVLPDGCVDAYQHFLAITGDQPQYAARVKDVKDILAGLEIKIDTKYNANQKKK